MKNLLITLFLFKAIFLYGQESDPYEAKLMTTDRLNIEYMDLGGKGSPLIVIQGAHNYFDRSSSSEYIRLDQFLFFLFR